MRCALQLNSIELVSTIFTYLDIEELLGEHWGSVVDWVTRSIEGSTKHFNAHWHPEYITGELASRGHVIDIGGTFENLNKKKHE